jgi:Domain of unknown function (DUF4267)
MLKRNIGYGLSGLVGLGISFIGARFLLAPAKAAAAYGVSVGATDPYLSVKGVRDIASGLITFVLIANGDPDVLADFLLAAAVIPVGDAAIVLKRGGKKATAFGVHGATAATMAVTAAFLLA